MPALVAFKRKWRVGSDDFVLPCLVSVIGRIIWLATGFIMYIVHRDGVQCPGGVFLEVYAVGEAILLLITVIIESYMVHVSAKGTITNVEPRRHFSKIFYVRVFVFVCEMVWNAVGTSWVFQEIANDETHECKDTVIHMIRTKVVASWILLAVIMLCAFLFLVPRKKSGKKRVSSQLVWEKRCKMLCCCVADDSNSRTAFKDVATLLASLFKVVDDVVMSDIAAGLVLVKAKQQANRSSLTSTPSVPASVIAEAAHFLPFASSAYGYPFFFLFGNPFCALCQLCGYFRVCRRHDQDLNDNCCECNMAVVRKVTNLEAADIVYMNYRNNIFQIPFYVAIDDTSKSVVVSIRGSLSSKDFLTDAVAESAKIDEVEDHELYGHKGILQAARDIRALLQKNGVLEKAFQKVPDYQLMIVGHSLGAGAAPLLSVLMRSDWPTLKCYAFEPPGGLINADGVEYTSSFVISTVMSDDIVPRLSIETLHNLKDEVISAIGRSDNPKYQTLLYCTPSACCTSAAAASDGPPHSVLVDCAETDLVVAQTGSSEVQTEKSESTQQPNSQRLYLPGKIMWVTERGARSDSGVCCGEKQVYQAKWVDFTGFNEILVGPRMVTDHICNELQKALDRLVEITPHLLPDV